MTRHTHIHLPVVAAALVTAAAIAACGGSSTPPSRTGDTTASSTGSKSPGQPAFHYATCMRNHGVSNFPDPRVAQNGSQVSVIVHLTPGITNSPAFRSAQQACAHYLPVGSGAHSSLGAADVRRRTADALAFARCVRGRGFPNFPDPTAQGQLTAEMVTAAGIDLHQPALLHAGLACISVTHGLLTAHDIEQAVSGSGG